MILRLSCKSTSVHDDCFHRAYQRVQNRLTS